MIDKNDEVFIAFVEEAREHLLTLEEDILGLESDGKSVNDETVNKVFRVAHSIKGTAAFLRSTKSKIWPMPWRACSVSFAIMC